MMPAWVTIIAEWCVALSGLSCLVIFAVWLSFKAIDKIADWFKVHEALSQFIYQHVREKVRRKQQ